MKPDVLERAQAGDRSAQREVLAEVGPRLAALVRRLGIEGDRDDQLQSLVMHVIEVLPKFRIDGSAQLTTWLHTVATRWLLMQRRKQGGSQFALDENDIELPVVAPEGPRVVEARTLEAALDAALTKLPEHQRRAFVLLQLERLSLEVVSDLEGVPVGTLKSRLHRARVALMLELGPLLDRGGAS
ncbi:MAG: RNA polymerase sigma factor [Archangium sp.]